MPVPELERRRVELLLSKFCEERVPTHVRHKVRLLFRFTGNTALLIERRPHFQRAGEFTESIIAKFKFDSANHGWSLYWGDRNNKFHLYEDTGRHRRFNDLLEEVNRDPTCIFWG